MKIENIRVYIPTIWYVKRGSPDILVDGEDLDVTSEKYSLL